MDLCPSAEAYLTELSLSRSRSLTTLSRRVLTRLAAYGPLTKQSIRAFLSDRAANGIAARTRSQELSLLKRYGKWLRRHGQPDPTLGIAHPKLPQCIPPEVTIAQATAACEFYPLGTHQRAALELLYATGCRVAELAALRWEDIDLDGWALVRGKGGKTRLVPFGRPCQAALTALGHRTGPVVGRSTYTLWRWVKATGLPGPHSLRHACATHMVDNGADIRVVQEILGHASAATTAIYTHVTESQNRSVYDRVWTARHAK